MRNKRILSVLLILLAVLCVLSGCVRIDKNRDINSEYGATFYEQVADKVLPFCALLQTTRMRGNRVLGQALYSPAVFVTNDGYMIISADMTPYDTDIFVESTRLEHSDSALWYRYEIVYDGVTYPAELVPWWDFTLRPSVYNGLYSAGLALVKVEGEFSPVTLASSNSISVGQPLLSVGALTGGDADLYIIESIVGSLGVEGDIPLDSGNSMYDYVNDMIKVSGYYNPTFGMSLDSFLRKPDYIEGNGTDIFGGSIYFAFDMSGQLVAMVRSVRVNAQEENNSMTGGMGYALRSNKIKEAIDLIGNGWRG